MERIADLCLELACTFTIRGYHWYAPKLEMRYEWQIECDKREHSNAAVGYAEQEDCIADCIAWLEGLQDERE